MDSSADKQTANRFPLIDSMRAVAALSVLLLHAAGAADKLKPDSFGSSYLQRLNCGVWIFFVISGFVLFRPFARAHLNGTPEPPTGPYAWRRTLRIVPAFWVALAITGLVIPGTLYLRNIPWTFGFAQIYRSSTSGMGIFAAWTLCVEVTFYAILPIYARIVGKFARNSRGWLRCELTGLAILFVAGVIYRVTIYSGSAPHVKHLAAGNFLPGWLDLFSIGMGLAVLQVWTENRPTTPLPLKLIERFPAVPWAIAALAFWVVSTKLAHAGAYNTWTKGQLLTEHYLDAIVALGLVLPAVFGDTKRGWVRRLLGHRWMYWLGLVSYGVYLWQAGWLEELKRMGLRPGPVTTTAAWLVLGFGGAIALGAASYYLVERPALRLKRLVPGTPRSNRTAGTSTDKLIA